ncbi:ricin-type beta-trefoil lectin domain protein, partial [Nonomuraea sp. NPDC049646]|uniref:ricin-type beta-trefoil lectin domain protein n=1 Tax=Nonomuraea sp. NPDC049646 TaxID=3364354 RepID=UPI0037AAD109
MLVRRLLSGAVLVVTASAGLVLPAAAAAPNPMCIDVTNDRGNGVRIYQWECQSNNNNQRFVIDGGQIKIKDTLGTSRPMCVDVTNDRGNGVRIYQWECQSNNNNQRFVIDGGQIKIKDTLGTSRPI